MTHSILVTGAAGFLGSFLCEELISQGYRVIGVDNFFRGDRSNITGLMTKKDFIFVEMDLSLSTNQVSLRQCILDHQIKWVCHLAAINGTQYFYDRPLFVLDQNIKITQTLIAAIENTPVNYLIYTSSSEVYGDPLQIPTPETHPIHLNAFAQRDSYAASKAVDEFYVRLYAAEKQIRYLICRVFNLYGERMVGTRYGQVVAEFIQRMLHEKQFTIIGDGSQTRSFCYIEDAVVAIRHLLTQQTEGIINVGNDKEITILELAKLIHQVENKPFSPVFLSPRADDHQRRCPDISLLKNLFPKLSFTDLKTGLKKVIDYYT